MAQSLSKAQTNLTNPEVQFRKAAQIPGRVSLSGPGCWLKICFGVFGKGQVLAMAIGEGRGAHACMRTYLRNKRLF